jgi:uncharacterized YccA/Bax inhibitor family protein
MNVSSAATQGQNQRPKRTIFPDVVGLNGAIAGLCGGVAMAVVAALLTRALDQDIWLQPKAIAGLVLGDASITAGFAAVPVLVGTLIHLVVSALLGAIFEIVARRILRLPSDFGTPMLVGLVYGMLTWMAAYFVVVPVLRPQLLAVYAPAFIIQHIVYGMVTSIIYALLRPQPFTSAAA